MRPVVFWLALASLPACRGCTTTDNNPFCGDLGCFLEDAPRLRARARAPMSAARPESIDGFRPSYLRIKTIEPGSDPARFSHGSMHADRPVKGATFRWPCPETIAELQAWVFTQSHWKGGAPLELEAGSARWQVPLPQEPNRLVRIAAPVPRGCGPDGRLTVALVGAPEPPAAVFVTTPRLVAETGREDAPVVLISLDTLRADFWDGRGDRPASLERLWSESVRFVRAFAPTGTTHPSHRVMLSGRLLGDTWNAPADESVAIAAGLRQRGWDTAAFNGGGYVRPQFGFGMGLPPSQRRGLGGFATGFDLYHERLEVEGSGERRSELSGRAFDLDLAGSTYTLGVALERSLGAIVRNPTIPFFHFVHGYDVHESRDVARAFFVAARRTFAGDAADLARCVEEVGVHGDEQYVVHWSNPDGTRDKRLGERTECHRMVTGVMYEARVRSVEAMLAAYLDSLRALGVYERALIIVTSDHGESLLDERRRDRRLHWGHNELLANNVRVPLWIKAPGATAGRDDDRVTSIVDLRATIAAALGIDLGATVGVDLLASKPQQRPLPLELDQIAKEEGVVLDDGTLCAWRKGRKPDGGRRGLRVHDGTWHPADEATVVLCEAARTRIEDRAEAGAGEQPAMTEADREELRALGYVDP